MDDLTKLKTDMGSVEDQLGQYTSELPSQIETELQKAYTPILQEATGVTKDMMSDYLGRYFDVTSMGAGMGGTSAIDLSPTQKLGVMGRELGTMSGQLQGAQQYADYLGAQMNDMYSKALQASQMGQQNLADKYARLSQQYQLAWQEAENAKDRATQQSIANQNRQAQFDLQKYFTQNQTQAPSQEELLKGFQATANAIAGQRGTGVSGGYTYQGQNLGDIDSVYSQIMDAAKSYGLNLNPKWVWQQLGNNIGPMSVPALI